MKKKTRTASLKIAVRQNNNNGNKTLSYFTAAIYDYKVLVATRLRDDGLSMRSRVQKRVDRKIAFSANFP
jgi:hypothetical protein